eukprot:GFKZ01014855.1.p1 GENE.GFKZ01014855.1~~GFKZ01014855.1.p1  ORF type:complete len:631 (+),score=124.35 GFKZ01014855.1:252-2144(+)
MQSNVDSEGSCPHPAQIKPDRYRLHNPTCASRSLVPRSIRMFPDTRLHAPFSTSRMSVFFLPPPQLPSSPVFKRHRLPLACTKPGPTAPQPSPPTTTNPQAPPVLRLPTPSSAPSLLRKPESVLAATAAGLFVLAATAWRSARVVIASFVARSFVLNDFHRRKQLLASREKERLFLETAVDSTQLTLDNTKTFLKAQQKRLAVSTERLRELEVERNELDHAADTVRKRRLELARLEAELDDAKRKGGNGRDDLRELAAKLDRLRDDLRLKEENVRCERERLEKEDAQQKAAVDATRAEADRLESVLVEKEIQLKREREERDAFEKRFGEVEKELGKRNVEFESTLGELEERRRRIESIQKESQSLGRVVKKRKAWLMQRGGENDLQPVEESSQRLQAEIESTLKSLALARDKKMEKTKERERLAGMVANRDAQISNLKDQLSALQQEATKDAQLRGPRENTSKEVLSPAAPVNELDRVLEPFLTQSAASKGDQGESDQKQAFQARMVPDDATMSLWSTDATIAHASADGNLQSAGPHGRSKVTQHTGDIVTLTSTVISDSDLHTKRRRGRPRKTPLPDELESKRPKRPRGRPRKTSNQDDTGGTPAAEPKRKRGRPRKKPLTPLVPQQAE